MTHQVKIENMRLVENRKFAAEFNAVVNGILLRRCMILRGRGGEMTVVPPWVPRSTPEEHAVWFIHLDLRDLFREAALDAYRNLVDEPDDAGVMRFLSAEHEACDMAGL